jgi:hypothetical protein
VTIGRIWRRASADASVTAANKAGDVFVKGQGRIDSDAEWLYVVTEENSSVGDVNSSIG